MTRPIQKLPLAIATMATLLSTGCSNQEDGTSEGSLTVLLASEELIFNGLEPGNDSENIRDGWQVDFEKYIVATGEIALALASDRTTTAEDSQVFVVDLTQLPSSGRALWHFDSLSAGRWEFHYSTPEAASSATKDPSVSADDFDAMIAEDWTYLIEGLLTQPKGQSCPPNALLDAGKKQPNGNLSGGNSCYDAPSLRFSFGVSAATHFGPCELDGLPGFVMGTNATQTVAATIHGDHLFFNGFPEGNEGGIQRLAQWLADCDLNLDGEITREELLAIAPSALPELDERYQLGGSPITPLDTMLDYVAAQLKTQGHFQGEGDCPLSSD